MTLRPKSSNLPEMQPEALAAAAAAAQIAPTLVPGSENAVDQENNENPKPLEERPQMTAQMTPKQETVTPKKDQKPVLGQQQTGKPSRTDNCNCPEVSVPQVFEAQERPSNYHQKAAESGEFNFYSHNFALFHT